MRITTLALLASFAAIAQEPPPPPDGSHRVAAANAALVLADDGGFDKVTARTLRSVTAAELRKHGVSVWEDARFNQVQQVDGLLSDMLKNMGVQRLFVLRVGGRLGRKIPLALEEADPVWLKTVYAADLVATDLEEADRNLARLVNAVLDRKAAGDTATMTTVTQEEKRPFQEKPGKKFWAIGFPFGFSGSTGRTYGTPFGIEASFIYEAEFVRVDLDFLSETHQSASTLFTGISAHWVPLDGQFSPYLGGGVGYLLLGGSDQSGSRQFGGGMGANVEGGVEMMRLQGFRLLAGFQILIPFFSSSSLNLNAVIPLASARVAF